MPKGDHIRVRRFGYTHHGIDAGNGMVIHFTGEPGKKSDAAIKETSMDEFLCGGKLEIVAYDTCLPPDETISIARGQIGQIDYNLIINNCEHFARFCKTKEKESEQVKDTVTNTTASIGGGVAVSTSITAVSAAGSAAGLSGAGILSGLAAIGPGGVIGGIATLASAPAIVSNIAVSKTLKDDDKLTKDERKLRKAGRIAAKVGTGAGAIGTVGTISAAGTVGGLSGAGIASGLAAIGSVVGGGMASGVAITVAAPAVAAAAAGFGVYKIGKILKKK